MMASGSDGYVWMGLGVALYSFSRVRLATPISKKIVTADEYYRCIYHGFLCRRRRRRARRLT